MSAEIVPAELEEIVGEYRYRYFRANLRRDVLPADAPLQLREWQRPSVLPWKNFSVDHGTIRQPFRRGDDFRKPVGDHLVTARPQVCVTSTTNQLRTDSVPLPFRLPLFDRPQFLDGRLEGIR